MKEKKENKMFILETERLKKFLSRYQINNIVK